jgi:hypothetical protein
MTKLFMLFGGARMEIQDQEGMDLPSLAEARREAIRGIRETMADEMRSTGSFRVAGRFIEIADADGAVLDTVHFRDALTIEADPPSPTAV